jgi:hypothetical protein
VNSDEATLSYHTCSALQNSDCPVLAGRVSAKDVVAVSPGGYDGHKIKCSYDGASLSKDCAAQNEFDKYKGVSPTCVDPTPDPNPTPTPTNEKYLFWSLVGVDIASFLVFMYGVLAKKKMLATGAFLVTTAASGGVLWYKLKK